jgi:hypothetical protein
MWAEHAPNLMVECALALLFARAAVVVTVVVLVTVMVLVVMVSDFSCRS